MARSKTSIFITAVVILAARYRSVAADDLSLIKESSAAACPQALEQAREKGWLKASQGFDHAPVNRVWNNKAIIDYLDYLLSSQYQDYLQSRKDQAWHTIVFKNAKAPKSKALIERLRRLKEKQNTDVIFLMCGK
ncbi:MAG: hypothetical protein HY078_05035 [Elusimicrobia bacterium]|nr:hypothetical protein [Elusimicrobiota bacterium]